MQIATVMHRAQRHDDLMKRFEDALDTHRDARRATDWLIHNAQLAERAGTTDDAQRELLRLLAEVQRPKPPAVPLEPELRKLTPSEAAHFWAEVGPLLADEQDSMTALNEYRDELHERGIVGDQYTAPLVADELLRLEEGGIVPDGELSRAVRRTWTIIGQGRIPSPTAPALDPLQQQAAAVASMIGGSSFEVSDRLAREEAGLAVEQSGPQVTIRRIADPSDPASVPESVTGYGVPVR